MNVIINQQTKRKKTAKEKIVIGTLIYVSSLLASYMAGTEAKESIQEELNKSGYELCLSDEQTNSKALIGLVPGVAPASAAYLVYTASRLNDEEYKAKFIGATLTQGKVKSIK